MNDLLSMRLKAVDTIRNRKSCEIHRVLPTNIIFLSHANTQAQAKGYNLILGS